MAETSQSPRVSPSQQADGFRERRTIAPLLRVLVDTAPTAIEAQELLAEIERLRATNPNGWGRAD